MIHLPFKTVGNGGAKTTTTITTLFVVDRCAYGVLFSPPQPPTKGLLFHNCILDINFEIQRIMLGVTLEMSSKVDGHYHHYVVCYSEDQSC